MYIPSHVLWAISFLVIWLVGICIGYKGKKSEIIYRDNPDTQRRIDTIRNKIGELVDEEDCCLLKLEENRFDTYYTNNPNKFAEHHTSQLARWATADKCREIAERN